MEIQGSVEEIIFRNDENGYTIASVAEGVDFHIVVGYMPTVSEGEMMRFVGAPTFHKTYGEQFKITSCEVLEPTGEKGILKYLSSGAIKGLGPALAQRIVKKFGSDTLDVFKYNPEKLRTVQGIGENKLKGILASYSEQRAMSDVVIFLQKFDISLAYATKIYQVFKEKTIEKISENPYILVEEIKGIGFQMADDIAATMGVERTSPYRVYSGIKHVLTLIINQGHTFAYEDDLVAEASKVLRVEPAAIKDELTELILKGDLHRTVIEDRPVIYLMAYYNAELNITKKLLKLAFGSFEIINIDHEALLTKYEKDHGISFAQNQKKAIMASTDQGVMVITGGPGTGKTTIINGIIHTFQEKNLKVLLAAPTGRAAKRMAEATGSEAKTLHRLLEYQYQDGGFLAFNRDHANPLEGDLIIVDEASMLDTILMSHLLEAVRPGTRMIFVGDVDQLPAVGAGNILKDMIASTLFETVVLEDIFRQASESMIVTNAHKINHGHMPDLNAKDKDFYMIKANSNQKVAGQIVSLCQERLPKYYDLDATKDIQVLCPMKSSPIGVHSLNKDLQAALNPPSDKKKEKNFGDTIFRVGDKVMQIKNNYTIAWEEKYTFLKGEGVFNGDIGYIEAIDVHQKSLTVLYDEEKQVVYDWVQLDELVLSYAVTVHKSQGSEFPVVVMPVFNVPPMLSHKNILYTAITRARKLVVLVGTPYQLKNMIDNHHHQNRNSGLKAMFKMVKDAYED